MKPILEQKLRALIEESERHGASAMYLVLNQLLASYTNGNHREFAKHSSRFMPFGFEGIEVTSSTSPKPEGEDAVEFKYIN